MYLKMPGLEAQNSNYESLSDEQLREQLDALKKQVDEMSKVLQQRQSWENPQWGGDQVNDSELNVDDVHLYRWWGERLEKNWVLEVIKSLKEPYKTEVNWFVKGKDILGLQRYLNAKIDSWAIDKTKIEAALSAKRIWLRGGHLLEDWKFWPQTLETIRVLAELPEESRSQWNSETVEESWNMSDFQTALKSAEIEEEYNRLSDLDRSFFLMWTKKIEKWDYSYAAFMNCLYREKKWQNEVEIFKSNSWEKTSSQISQQLFSHEYEWNLADGFWNTLQSHMEEKFKDLLKLSDNTEIKMSSYKTISFRLSPMQVVGSWWNSVVPQITMDPRKFLTENWSAFADERIQSIIIPDILKKLSDKKKTIVAYNALKWKKYDRKAIFSDTEFNDLGPNDQQLVKNYFNYFDDGTLEFNYDTPTDTAYDISGDRANLKLRLDDDNGDEDWNKRNNNPNLIFPWSEVVGDDFKLNEGKLKGKLRDIILKAIKREDFK